MITFKLLSKNPGALHLRRRRTFPDRLIVAIGGTSGNRRRYLTLPYLTLPYLTLPYGGVSSFLFTCLRLYHCVEANIP